MFQFKADAVTPPNNTTERYQITEYPDATPGPNMIGYEYWVDTADPGSSAALQVDLYYTNPKGIEGVIFGTPIGLNNDTEVRAVPVQVVERDVAAGMFELRVTVVGDPGSALISYHVLMTPSAECDLQAMTLTLVP